MMRANRNTASSLRWPVPTRKLPAKIHLTIQRDSRHCLRVRTGIKFSELSTGENGCELAQGNPVPVTPTYKPIATGFTARTGACRMKLLNLQTWSHLHRQNALSTLSDWVATCLVCLMFVGMLSAMLVVLIGEAR